MNKKYYVLYTVTGQWPSTLNPNSIENLVVISESKEFLEEVRDKALYRVHTSDAREIHLIPLSQKGVVEEWSLGKIEDYLHSEYHDMMYGDEDRCPTTFARTETKKDLEELKIKGTIHSSRPLFFSDPRSAYGISYSIDNEYRLFKSRDRQSNFTPK